MALLVRMSDRGPIFFSHQRVGYQYRPFGCIKFRTMVVDSQAVLANYLANNPEAQREWEVSRKLTHDPRVTPLGNILRLTSLDELPQLWNILRGDMSIVGPRPVVQDELRKYGVNAQFYAETRPGLTGAWQVSGRSDTQYETRVALDRAYVETWSMRKDVVIILRTIPAVIFSRGAY
ncbi:exopolysaccharide production protein ExoY [Variibacter gotjawalensis]|nr:exopolysaccharide production protein ExoY [Variibacter gotjawalensis]